MRANTGLKPPSAPLLGRDRELVLIGELCERAARGQGGVLLIEGPAGIGKTSLLHAARELGDGAGLELAVARGGELEREFAYGLVRQLADPVLRRQTPAGRAELLAGAAGLAAPALGLRSDETTGIDSSASSAEELESEQAATFHGLY